MHLMIQYKKKKKEKQEQGIDLIVAWSWGGISTLGFFEYCIFFTSLAPPSVKGQPSVFFSLKSAFASVSFSFRLSYGAFFFLNHLCDASWTEILKSEERVQQSVYDTNCAWSLSTVQ